MFQVFFFGFTSGCLIGFAVDWIWKKFTQSKDKKEMFDFRDTLSKTYKLALIINKELKMGAGKIVAQCSHAAVGIYESHYETHRFNFDKWEEQGKQISIYKCTDAYALKALQKTADARNMITYLVRDAGLTQIAAGSTTVLAIGPEDDSVLNSIVEYLLPYP